jgi:hypothetical protein
MKLKVTMTATITGQEPLTFEARGGTSLRKEFRDLAKQFEEDPMASDGENFSDHRMVNLPWTHLAITVERTD